MQPQFLSLDLNIKAVNNKIIKCFSRHNNFLSIYLFVFSKFILYFKKFYFCWGNTFCGGYFFLEIYFLK